MRQGSWVPASVEEYLRCAPDTSMKNLIVTVILTASLNYTSCNNTAIFNLAGNIVPSDLLGALGNNLNFCPTHYPSPASLRREVTAAYLHLAFRQ